MILAKFAQKLKRPLVTLTLIFQEPVVIARRIRYSAVVIFTVFLKILNAVRRWNNSNARTLLSM